MNYLLVVFAVGIFFNENIEHWTFHINIYYYENKIPRVFRFNLAPYGNSLFLTPLGDESWFEN